ncbi:Uncharacterised protein [Streptococcus macacae NCTC 11558]|nr:Uncharacterised protein [Streptococcus macacae NCTC 11558]
MSQRSSKSAEKKLKIVQLYLKYTKAFSQLLETYQISEYTFKTMT